MPTTMPARAVGDLGQRGPPGRRAERAGDQGRPGCRPGRRRARRPGRARPSSVADAAVVLGGEHLGRGEQRGLPAGVDHLEHRPQRDQRLAGADLALQQPVHRVRLGQVGGDLLADRRAAPRSARTAGSASNVARIPASARRPGGAGRRRPPGAWRCTRVSCTANASSHLSRYFAAYSASLRARAVDLAQGGADADQVAVGPDRGRQRVVRRLERVQHASARTGRSPRSARPRRPGRPGSARRRTPRSPRPPRPASRRRRAAGSPGR